VIGRRVVQLRQQPSSPSSSSPSCCYWRLASRPPRSTTDTDQTTELAAAEAALRDYLNLGPDRPRLADLAQRWAESDARYRAVASGLPGARMLRQPPLECLFSFVCSSNNHISRIHGMVERLCARYGSPIELEPWAARDLAALAKKCLVVPATPATLGSSAEEEEEEEEWAGAAAGGEDEDAVVKVELKVATPGGSKGGRNNKRGGGGGGAAAPRSDEEDEAGEADAADAPAFWAFPTLEQLAAASEEALRGDGFG
jgi:3-methyladenine DNA glycosylase/8-oxoguanine DNA glycosylase